MSKLLFLLLLFPFSLSAQNSIGIYGGLANTNANISNSYNPTANSSYFSSYSMGAFINFPIYGVLSFQSEVNFMQQGYKFEYSQGSASSSGYGAGEVSEKYVFNNTSLPFLLRVAQKSERDRFFILVGVAPILNMGAQEFYSFNGIKPLPYSKTYIIKTQQKTGLGLIINPGLEINIYKKFCMLLGIRYQYNLTNIYAAEPVSANGNFSTISINMGLLLLYK